MKIRNLFVALSLLVCSFSVQAFEASDLDAIDMRGEYIQPCEYWNYDSDVRNYVCSRKNFGFNAATVPEVQRVIDQLVRRIDDLERRVQRLESGK